MAELMDKVNANIEVSVVVPLYNEAGNLSILYNEITRAMKASGREYELIFVNDGSKDDTENILKDLFKRDSRVNVINLRCNFGQTAALTAGFDFARGMIVISLDGDLQHDPVEIPKFLAKIDEGYDIVSGWRERRVDNFLTRRLPSLVANKIMSFLSGVKIHDFGTTFKAYRRDVISNIELSSDLHRFIPALASSMGVKIVEIPIKNIVRKKGHSNYGLSRVLPVFYDFVIVKFFASYFSRPMRVFGLIGVIAFAIGFVIALLLAIDYYFHGLSMRENEGNIALSVFFMLSGVQFVLNGILIELATRIYRRITDNDIFWIKDKN